jgi:hypothetical protein
MQIQRRFTRADADPYEGLEFEPRATEIRNPDGSVVFAMDNVMAPRSWSQVAVDVLAQKYFRKAGLPLKDADGNPVLDSKGRPMTGSESDARQVFHRLAGCWTYWGREYGYFDTEDDAQTFYSELCAHAGQPDVGAQFAAVVQHRAALGLRHHRPGPGTLVLRSRHRRADAERLGLRAPAAARLLHPERGRRPGQRGRHHGSVDPRGAAVQVRLGHRLQFLGCAGRASPCPAAASPPA